MAISVSQLLHAGVLMSEEHKRLLSTMCFLDSEIETLNWSRDRFSFVKVHGGYTTIQSSKNSGYCVFFIHVKLSTRLECTSGVISKIRSHTALRRTEFLSSNAKWLDGTLVAFSIFKRRSSSGRGASLEPTQRSSCEGRAHSAAKQTIHSYGGVKACVKTREPPISLPCMHVLFGTVGRSQSTWREPTQARAERADATRSRATKPRQRREPCWVTQLCLLFYQIPHRQPWLQR